MRKVEKEGRGAPSRYSHIYTHIPIYPHPPAEANPTSASHSQLATRNAVPRIFLHFTPQRDLALLLNRCRFS